MDDLKNSTEGAEEFLKISKEFRLGSLPTESPHPLTTTLSSDAKNNLPKAIESIKSIDENVFLVLKDKIPEILKLKYDVEKTLESGHRIFLCGCGATGRLSLAIETIWRTLNPKNHPYHERVVSFMAGGDVALIHSVEKFEDFPEFGFRQLKELGFSEGDLLISTTEGGETPFVIGATEGALSLSTRAPYFLYCNPDEILVQTTERSKKVIENSQIKKINLTTGPMALTGSTRMQATTILMYGVGLAVTFQGKKNDELTCELEKLTSFIQKTSFNFLEKFIIRESEIYKNQEYVLYEADRFLGISILTDTTERSPTFSLHSFENQQDEKKVASLSYLYFPHQKSSHEAWEELLQRAPRAFYWKEVTHVTSIERLYGFDFSSNLLNHRKDYLASTQHIFKITYNEEQQKINFSLDQTKFEVEVLGLHFLSVHMVLKILLNNMSTLIMGRMGRYEANLMTWVRASNYKLIDRSVRYAQVLLKEKNKNISYEDLVHCCYRLKDNIARDEALVLKMVEEFSH